MTRCIAQSLRQAAAGLPRERVALQSLAQAHGPATYGNLPAGRGYRARGWVACSGDPHVARSSRRAPARASDPAGVAPTLGATGAGTAGSDIRRRRPSGESAAHRACKCGHALGDRRNDGRVAGTGLDAHRGVAGVSGRRCDDPGHDGGSLCIGHDRGPDVDGLVLGRRAAHALSSAMTSGAGPLIKPCRDTGLARPLSLGFLMPLAQTRTLPHSPKNSR